MFAEDALLTGNLLELIESLNVLGFNGIFSSEPSSVIVVAVRVAGSDWSSQLIR